jgi:hypothetical protein
MRSLFRAVLVASALATLLLGFQTMARPWFLDWGATADERQWSLAGDDIVPGEAVQHTRAMTIHAAPSDIWPWLAQLGQDRGGFYSYDLLENAVGCRMPTDDVLRPDRQEWRLGDRLWMYPPDRAGGIGFATLREYEPGRALGFATRVVGTRLEAPENGSWSFALIPMGERSTRLLVRGRATMERSLAGTLFDRLVFEPAHYVMERRMMAGLAAVSRGLDRGRWRNHVEVALWTVTFGLFAIAAVGVFRRRDWRLPLAAFFAAGIVFQVLTLLQPPLVVGAGLILFPALLLLPASVLSAADPRLMYRRT